MGLFREIANALGYRETYSQKFKREEEDRCRRNGICVECRGSGEVTEIVGSDTADGPEYETYTCSRCRGSGRR